MGTPTTTSAGATAGNRGAGSITADIENIFSQFGAGDLMSRFGNILQLILKAFGINIGSAQAATPSGRTQQVTSQPRQQSQTQDESDTAIPEEDPPAADQGTAAADESDTAIPEEEPAQAADAGYKSFQDFMTRNDYQTGPQWSAESLKQNPHMAPGGAQHAQAYAMAVAKNISSLDPDSVSINQTVGAAIVATAVADPDDPNKGQMNYVVFMPGAAGNNPDDMRTYVFTENITVNGDGSITSQMEAGKGWVMHGEESAAYGNLVDKFAGAIAAKGQPSAIAAFESSSGKNLPDGGLTTRGGEVEIRHGQETRLGKTFDVAAAASASDLNAHTGLEIEVAYSKEHGSDLSAGVDGQVRLRVFRENLEGAVTEQGVADGPDNAAKFERNQGMSPGIYSIDP